MAVEPENYQGVHRVSDLGIILQAGAELNILVEVLARPGKPARFRTNILISEGIVVPAHTEIIRRGFVLIEIQNRGNHLGDFWDRVNDLRVIAFPTTPQSP